LGADTIHTTDMRNRTTLEYCVFVKIILIIILIIRV
jgi:hypothetical protein